MSGKTIHQLQVELAQRGINWFLIPGIQIAHPEHLSSLTPLLAQAKHFDDKIQVETQAQGQLEEEATQLVTANLTDNRSKISELRLEAQFAEERAMDAKVQAAFVNAVLRNGDFNGSLEDIADHAKIGDNVLFFKNRNLAPITRNELKTMTVAQLGQRLHAVMA